MQTLRSIIWAGGSEGMERSDAERSRRVVGNIKMLGFQAHRGPDGDERPAN